VDAERAYLQQHVFPELSRWCADRGVTLEVVDPRAAGAAPGPGGVRRWLEEVERCRPFFLAVIGQTCGEAVGPPTEEDVRAYPWLAEHADLTPLELEILHGVVWDPSRAAHSFFYLRRPQSLDAVPPAQRRPLADVSLEEQARLESLRK